MADINALPPVKCIQCGGPSHGAKFSDGSIMRSLCQKCKDEADEQVNRTMQATWRHSQDFINRINRINRAELAARGDTDDVRLCPVCRRTLRRIPAELDTNMPARWECWGNGCDHSEDDK